MGYLKHIIAYFYLVLYLIIHLIFSFNLDLSLLFSGYLYAYLVMISIPLIVLCGIYFWLYFKFPKNQRLISVFFLIIPIIFELTWILIKDPEGLIEYLKKDGLAQNHFYETLFRFLITGIPLAIIMGLLLDILMKWFIIIDEKVKRI